MLKTLELENFIQDYFRETITNFLAEHRENGFLVLQMYPKRGEKVKFLLVFKKLMFCQ